jgi:hypothetical protein
VENTAYGTLSIYKEDPSYKEANGHCLLEPGDIKIAHPWYDANGKTHNCLIADFNPESKQLLVP